jgi:hypothetical protein
VIEIAEGLAEGTASPAQRRRFWEACEEWKEGFVAEQDFLRAADLRDIQRVLAPPPPSGWWRTGLEHLAAALAKAEGRAFRAASWILQSSNGQEGPEPARQAQCHTLRELLGPLPVRAVVVSPWLLAWQDGTVARLAESIYQEQAFDRFPILADALEDAGCTESDILEHLRDPGPHVRGCWALDPLVGRE